MGTSGNRPGNKVFSISTTIRNPKRNKDFLEAFQAFDGKILDESDMYFFMFELVKRGIYKFTNLTETVKDKLEADIELTAEEVKEAIQNNPQATGLVGRVMTWIRSLKDQGFLIIEKSGRISISKLGKALIENSTDATSIYTKAMIGMHANNPSRPAMHNKSRPFLNTLFVINEVNKQWRALGNKPKGILKHEFSYFVLSMIDCDYMSAAKEIIEYRKKYRYEPNQVFAKEYLERRGLKPLAEGSLLEDYPDDVFRKFSMTGLLIEHGNFNYKYYNFSTYHEEKVNAVLDYYKDYSFESFSSQNEYYEYLYNIVIPWESDEQIRKKIIEAKARVLSINMNETWTLDQQEEMLDRMFYSDALSKAVEKYNIAFIFKELLILSGNVKEVSKFKDISEPLRLEYLLALAFGKLYGTNGLISNIIYNEEGEPLHCAPGGKCDIKFIHKDGSYILEPTMQRSRNQQLNNETTNIARHVRKENQEGVISYRVIMVAPVVHPDVVDYFKYASFTNKVSLLSATINRIVALLNDSPSVVKLNHNFDVIFETMMNTEIDEFADLINTFKPETVFN